MLPVSLAKSAMPESTTVSLVRTLGSHPSDPGSSPGGGFFGCSAARPCGAGSGLCAVMYMAPMTDRIGFRVIQSDSAILLLVRIRPGFESRWRIFS